MHLGRMERETEFPSEVDLKTVEGESLGDWSDEEAALCKPVYYLRRTCRGEFRRVEVVMYMVEYDSEDGVHRREGHFICFRCLGYG